MRGNESRCIERIYRVVSVSREILLGSSSGHRQGAAVPLARQLAHTYNRVYLNSQMSLPPEKRVFTPQPGILKPGQHAHLLQTLSSQSQMIRS